MPDKRIPRGKAIDRTDEEIDALLTPEAVALVVDEAVADAERTTPELGARLNATDAE